MYFYRQTFSLPSSIRKELLIDKKDVGDADEKVILITGHSRGAAIANILGTFFEASDGFSSYTYTFATPNTTTDKNASSYKTIFNIKNADDLIPYLPIETWAFGDSVGSLLGSSGASGRMLKMSLEKIVLLTTVLWRMAAEFTVSLKILSYSGMLQLRRALLLSALL